MKKFIIFIVSVVSIIGIMFFVQADEIEETTIIEETTSDRSNVNVENYRFDWYYIDNIDGDDNNDGKSVYTAFKTFEPILKIINGADGSSKTMVNVYLRGNATLDDKTTRIYNFGDKNSEDPTLQGGAYNNGVFHMFFCGYGIDIHWEGTEYLKKIYNGHINIKPCVMKEWGISGDTSNMRLTWSWDNDINYNGTDYKHSWYWSFENCNITISQVDFTGCVQLNGVNGSFTSCTFGRLCGIYCHDLQFLTSLGITAGTSNLTVEEYKTKALSNFCRYGNIDFRTCSNILFRCSIDYYFDTTIGHEENWYSFITLLFGDYKILSASLFNRIGIEVDDSAEIEIIEEVEAIPYIGDVDGNEKIEASDARLCLRIAVGLEDCIEGSCEFYACDVSGDLKITAEDARLILRAAVGLETFEEAISSAIEEINIEEIITDEVSCSDFDVAIESATIYTAILIDSVKVKIIKLETDYNSQWIN